MCKIIIINSIITVSYIQYTNFNLIVKNVLYSLNLQIYNNEELVNKRYNLINFPKLIHCSNKNYMKLVCIQNNPYRFIGSDNDFILFCYSRQTHFIFPYHLRRIVSSSMTGNISLQ